ncbi:MAG: SGNH/GDSL hydrolase family protein [Vicinamibacteria bacterium]|jgi:lysophospholipase L1-like esterase|nr:SGNH/GDSL hydrolase family protein [Vicinamibacteria bacterium]
MAADSQNTAGTLRCKRLLGNLALASVSIVIMLAGFEALARWERSRERPAPAPEYTERDPLLGWRKKAGCKVSLPHGDYAMNSHGLRDVERVYPTRGVFRLLALGDSFTEGFSVRFEESVTRVLEGTLHARQCPVEVINGGTVGYSTDQEYLFYIEEGARYSPKVVLVFFYYNDILYNGRASQGRAPKPLIAFREGKPYVKNYPLPEPLPAEPPAAAPPPASGSAALAWLQARLARSAPRTYNAFARIGLWPVLERTEPGVELRVYEREPPLEAANAWAHTVSLLRALKTEVEARSARLMVVYIPSKMEVSDENWELTRLTQRIDEPAWDRRAVVRRLAEAGRTSGFPVLDLTDPLRRAQTRFWGGPYHAAGGHWNALGHRIAAREVARKLAELGWLPPCAAARTGS